MTDGILVTNDATASLGSDGMTSYKKKRTRKHNYWDRVVYSCELHKHEVLFQGTAPMCLVFTSDKHKQKFDISNIKLKRTQLNNRYTWLYYYFH